MARAYSPHPAEAEAKGWLCCRDLKARHRLMPGYSTRPAGSVWQGRGAYHVYDPADCVPWKWEPSARSFAGRTWPPAPRR
jgi:hypothetical protein